VGEHLGERSRARTTGATREHGLDGAQSEQPETLGLVDDAL
jgi:hypothetical protein